MTRKRYLSGNWQFDGHKILGKFPLLHTGIEVAESGRYFRAIIVLETFGQQLKIVVFRGRMRIIRIIEVELMWLVFVPWRKCQDGTWLFMLDDDCKGAI